MSKLSPKERALVDLARKGWGPSARVKQAVRAGVPARLRSEPTLGDGAPGPEDVTSPTGRIASASAFVQGPRGVVAGLAVVGLCVVFGARGIGVGGSGPSMSAGALVAPAPSNKPPSNHHPEAEPRPPPESQLGVAPPSDSAEGASAPGSTSGRSERGAQAPSTETSPPAKNAVAAARPSAPSEEVPRVDTLAEEVALVRAAQKSLRDGAPKDALATLSTHATRFPGGALREERMTLQVLALCELGDLPKARSVRAELERLAPASSHLRRLACAAQ